MPRDDVTGEPVALAPARRAASSAERPALIVVVDTEEEFDWSAPFSREATHVGHMRHIHRLQAVCEAWGVRPVYVVDYAIASQEAAAAPLRGLLQDGRALVGAHLHPWVSPPHEEELSARNSFPGNLPPALERAKIAALCDRIATAFGTRPAIYKAGRYGLGPRTFGILEELGFGVDLSPAPPFDYSAEGGPDFTRRGLAPSWAGPGENVLSIPGTGALIGWLPHAGLYRTITAPALAPLRLPRILSTLGVVERLQLTPEGHGVADMARLVRWLHRRGQRLFVLSLHSPSLEPGHTPYVRCERDVERLLVTLSGFLRFFAEELGGVPTDPLAVRAALAAAR